MGSGNYLNKIGIDTSQVSNIAQITDKLQSGAGKLSKITKEIQNDLNSVFSETSKSTDKAGNSAVQVQSKLVTLKKMLFSIAAAGKSYGKTIVNAFDNAIDKAQELANNEDVLFEISKTEIDQGKLYKKEMEKTGNAIDSIKTKIALNLAPAVTDLIISFRNWLIVNKELISKGITTVITWVSKAIQVIINFGEFIDKIISNTIGWENAIIALAVVWAKFNQALLFSPIGIVIGLLTVLMLLIDDLMVYMKGGKSLFGEYWQPFIDGTKAAWSFIKSFWELIQAFWSGDTQKVKSISKKLFNSLVNGVKSLIRGIKSLLSNLLKNILMFFGMSEKDAMKTVDRIGKIFGFIVDVLTFPFRMAYQAICAIMDWLGIDAGDVVNAIGEIFKAIWGFITTPFKAAWKFVNDLFDIWEDDTTSTTDKLGKTLWAIWDFITWPFKAAWNFVKGLFPTWVKDGDTFTTDFDKSFSKVYDFIVKPFEDAKKWIEDKFISVLDKVKNKLRSGLSMIGINIDDDDSSGESPSNNQQLTPSPSMPMVLRNPETSVPTNSWLMLPQNNNVRNNAVTVNTTMHVNSAQEGIDNIFKIVDSKARQISDNSNTAMGSN